MRTIQRQPMQQLEGRDAFDFIRKNTFRKWHGGTPQDPDLEDMKTACARLKKRKFMGVKIRKKFSLPRDGFFFTMGSCFALHINRQLAEAGLNVWTEQFDLDQRFFKKRAAPRSVLIKKNYNCIFQALERALEGRQEEDGHLYEIRPGQYSNGELVGLALLNREDSLYVTKAVDEAIREVREADVVVLTLGYTETWQDTVSGTYHNSFNPVLLKKHADRLAFFNPGPAEVADTIAAGVEMLNAHCKRGLRILFTLSPIPLAATFTDQDVVTANTYSKSCLRAGIQAAVERFENVDYFPSYEMVTHSHRPIAWNADERHPTEDVVDRVTQTFMGKYFKAADPSPGS